MPDSFSSIDVIVPVLNEEAVLPTFYRRVRQVPLPLNLIFVDNASHDQTVPFIKSLNDVRLIQHSKNEGYGGSVLDGIKHSTAEALVIIDADCEYPPEEIPALIAALKQYPIVYGSRFKGHAQPQMGWVRRVGNQAITRLFNLLFGQHLTDLYTGFKALRKSAIADLPLKRRGFEHVLELASRLAQRGIAIHEIPVIYAPRSSGKSKMNHITETVKLLTLLLKYRLERGPSSGNTLSSP